MLPKVWKALEMVGLFLATLFCIGGIAALVILWAMLIVDMFR